MEEFTSYVDRLKKLATDTSPDELQENLDVFFANGCLLLTSFLQEDGKEGWSSKVINDYGQPILGFKEQANVESIFKSAPWIRGIFKGSAASAEAEAQAEHVVQKGGVQLTTDGSIVKTITETLANIKGDDVSLDGMLQALIKKTAELDETMNKFNGPFKKMTSFDIPLGPAAALAGAPGIPFQPVLYLLLVLLDSFRVSRALLGNKDTPLTVLVLLEEIISGQWRQALLTSVGLISPSGVAIGTIAKYFVNAWILINPTLRTEIVKLGFKGTKSIVLGFLLWCVSILPPEFIRKRMEESVDNAVKLVADIETKIYNITDEGNKVLNPQGKHLIFRGLNSLKQISKISIENLQNIQELGQWPALTCSKEFREIIDGLRQDPLFRLVIEMSNIPVTKEDTYQVCRKTSGFLPLTDLVQMELTPEIEKIELYPAKSQNPQQSQEQQQQPWQEQQQQPWQEQQQEQWQQPSQQQQQQPWQQQQQEQWQQQQQEQWQQQSQQQQPWQQQQQQPWQQQQQEQEPWQPQSQQQEEQQPQNKYFIDVYSLIFSETPIGININKKDGDLPIITNVVQGSEAYRKGIREGDTLMLIKNDTTVMFQSYRKWEIKGNTGDLIYLSKNAILNLLKELKPNFRIKIMTSNSDEDIQDKVKDMEGSEIRGTYKFLERYKVEYRIYPIKILFHSIYKKRGTNQALTQERYFLEKQHKGFDDESYSLGLYDDDNFIYEIVSIDGVEVKGLPYNMVKNLLNIKPKSEYKNIVFYKYKFTPNVYKSKTNNTRKTRKKL